jgi:hypothetical protein
MPPSTLIVNLRRARNDVDIGCCLERRDVEVGRRRSSYPKRGRLSNQFPQPKPRLLYHSPSQPASPATTEVPDESACELKGGPPSIDMSLDAARKSLREPQTPPREVAKLKVLHLSFG